MQRGLHMSKQDLLREAVQRPMMLPYHPLYRFYKGGSLVRSFRGIPDTPDDWWSEDWVGSCTVAGNKDPQGNLQGLSTVDVPEVGPVTLKTLVEMFPEEMVGARVLERYGPTTAVLVKILSPAGPVPLHVHPSREWAAQHLGSPFGKLEGWILLETPGDGTEPAYFATGFKQGVTKEWFREMVERRDGNALRGALHRTEVKPSEVYVAYPGVPHCVGPQILAIEVQEPTDHMVIAEWSGDDEKEATMGLGWDVALELIDYTPTDWYSAVTRARQRPSLVREQGENRETRLVNADVLGFFDATRLDIAQELAVEDGRFYIGIVIDGEGWVQGDFGRIEVRKGDAFACAASLGHRICAGRRPISVVRCMGPMV